MARIGVVIPTRNRPDELRHCLESLAAQERVPDAVLVVDAGDDELAAEVGQRVRDRHHTLAVSTLSAPRRGLTLQRNDGVAALDARCDLVQFADDDVVFAPDHLGRLESLLESDGSILGVAGVSEVLTADEAPGYYRALVGLFLLGTRRKRGQVLLSGVNIAPPGGGPPVDVDWLYGCAMYRRSVFDEMAFAEELTGYALLEDVDFSVRARQLGRLVVDPGARLVHESSLAGRPDVRESARVSIANRYWLVRRHPEVLSRIAFWWSVLGLLGLRAAQVLMKRRREDLEALRGAWAATVGVMAGRCLDAGR